MRKSSRLIAATSSFVIVAFVVSARAAEDAKYVQPKEADAIQSHVDKAYQIAGDDPNFTNMIHFLCGPKGTIPANDLYSTDHNTLPPAKVFDQLYHFGVPFVASWAITTSEGIILIDTLDNPEEAERVIEGGMRSVGLDPAQIKYIVLTHAHADHYGGAKYLQDKYHPHVLMSKADWDMLERPLAPGQRPPAGWENRPAHDMLIEDGQKLTLGDMTVTFYLSPGHTPGTASMIFRVTDDGTPHVAGLMGGVGFPTTIDPTPTSGGMEAFIKSNRRFLNLVDEQGIDVVLSPHASGDNHVEKLDRLVYYNRPGDPNPFVVGKAGAKAYYGVFDQCAQAAEERIKAKAAAGSGPPASPGAPTQTTAQ